MRARFVEAEVKRQGKGEEIEILPDSGDVCLSLSYYRISAEREREREREREKGGMGTTTNHQRSSQSQILLAAVVSLGRRGGGEKKNH